jgi:hypothetical protein
MSNGDTCLEAPAALERADDHLLQHVQVDDTEDAVVDGRVLVPHLALHQALPSTKKA